MFPLVLLLALSGVTVGMLNTFERFSVPALAPVAWNLVIIASLVGLTPLLDPEDEIYSYAIGVLAGTIVQFVLPLPWLRGTGGRFTLNFDWRNPYVIRIIKLMLPVTIALGLINFSLLINSFIGTLAGEEVPAAIDKAFRIYMLPAGPVQRGDRDDPVPDALAHGRPRGHRPAARTMANGLRQILLMLIPSAVIMAVLAEPITRLVYERGEFDAQATTLVSDAMFWWAFSLPGPGRQPAAVAHVLRAPAALGHDRAGRRQHARQRRGIARALQAVRDLGHRDRHGRRHAGMAAAQAFLVRRDTGGLEGPRMIAAVRAHVGRGGAARRGRLRRLVAGRRPARPRALGTGRQPSARASPPARPSTAAVVWALGVPEARQIVDLFGARFRRRRG